MAAADHSDLVPLGAAMRAEWQAETEAAIVDATERRRHEQTLVDWLTDHMHAGDWVAATCGSTRFEGEVEEVSPDLVALRTRLGRVDLHLVPGAPVVFHVADHRTAGGRRAPTSRSFRDALLARDGRDDLTIGTTFDADGVNGRLLVSADFVTVVARLGGETVIPLDHVIWVRPRL